MLQAPILVQHNARTRPSCPVHSFSFCFHGARLGFQRSLLRHGRTFKWSDQDAHLWRRMPLLHHEPVGRLHAPSATAPGESKSDTNKWVQYELPAINCGSFSVKCHPDYESVRVECDAWMFSLFDAVQTEEEDPQRHALHLKGRYSLFTSLFFPSTPSRRRLVLLAKFTTWFFILDDMVENADMRTATELFNGLHSLLTSSFDNYNSLAQLTWSPDFPVGTSIPHSNNGVPLPPVLPRRRTGHVSAFLERFQCDVWDEMCRDMTPSLKLKLAAGLMSSINGMKEHTCMQHKAIEQEVDSTKPTFDYLMEVRLHDAFGNLFFGALMEYMLEIDVQDIQHVETADLLAKVEELKLAATMQAIWVNDIFSLRKELFKGDRLSVLALLLSERGIHSISDCKESGDVKLQEVINEVWGMIKEQEIIAERLLKEIKHGPGSNLRAHTNLVMYSEEMCTAMAGNMYWSTLTARYNGLHPLPWNTNTPTLLSLSGH